ncbi:MAG: SdiA-regulated domain-containing protein [Candidatus Eiseniibacteriota bacterium]|jgi:uncharacterized protein YjiK
MRNHRSRVLDLLIGVAWLLPAGAAAQPPAIENVLDLSGTAAFVGGITYDPTTDHLFVADLNANAVLEVERTGGSVVASWPTPGGTGAPTGITYVGASDHLFFVSETTNQLVEVTRDGVLVAAYTLSVPPVSVSGCTFNSLTGTLFVVDDGASTMIESTLDGTVLGVVSLLGFGIFDADGITYNAVDNTMFVGDDIGRRLYEITADGSLLLNIYDLGPVGLNTGGVEGLGFDQGGERLFLAHGATRLVYEISGVTGGGTVAIEPASWGRVKATFAR